MRKHVAPVPEALLDQLRQKFNLYPHFSASLVNGLTEEQRGEKFIELNHPYLWLLAEEEGHDKVLIDVGRGMIAYFKRDVFVAFFKKEFVGSEIVILDKEYYGSHKYIWR